MNSLAANVERGHAGRRQEDHLLGRRRTQVVQQGRFPGSCFAGDEDALALALDQVDRLLELSV
jgi:hypothetical protein